MAKVTLKERTISFYEVVISRSAEQHRTTQIDFQAILSVLGRAPVEKRRHDAEVTYVGTTRSVDDEDHLLLHRVRDRAEWLSVMDLQTGDWRELESKAAEGYLDTTAVTFLGYGNVVAMMRGSNSAPTHKALEAWFNHLRFLKDTTVIVRPLISKAEVDRLRTASGASRIEIRVGAHRIAALSQKQGRLAQFLKRATDDYGDLRVTITISVPPGGARDGDRRRLLADLQDLEEVMPGAADAAKARLVYADAGGEEYGQLVEFIEHHITAKRRVPAVDEAGNSIRLNAALQVMVAAAIEHEDELRLAADVEGP